MTFYIIGFFCLLIVMCVLFIGTNSWKVEFQPLQSWREFIVAAIGGGAFLYLVYNCELVGMTSNAGNAVFLALLIPIFWLGRSSRENQLIQIVLSLMLAFSAGRIFCVGCSGNIMTGVCALLLVFVLAAVCCGTPMNREIMPRYIWSSVVHALPRGVQNLQLVLHLPQFNIFTKIGCATILLPLFSLMIFGWIFSLANPGLVVWFKSIWHNLLAFNKYLSMLLNHPLWHQLFGSFLSYCVLCGILAPRVWTPSPASPPAIWHQPKEEPVITGHLTAFFYILVAVIIGYGFQLVYEFSELLKWTSSDYRWYIDVCILMFAPLILSYFFSPKVCRHERVRFLKYLAFVWIVENILLAVSIYIRLGIYIHTNGLTNMRVIGFLGTTALLVGLVWMIVKLQKDRSNAWLFGRYAWTIAVFIWIYSVLPVDAIVWNYNMKVFEPKEILGQIANHNISQEGLLPLFPLLKSEDPSVREGVATVIMKGRSVFLKDNSGDNSNDWRHYFLLKQKLEKSYQENKAVLDEAEKKELKKQEELEKLKGQEDKKDEKVKKVEKDKKENAEKK